MSYVVAVLSLLSPYGYDLSVANPPVVPGLDTALIGAGCVFAFTATYSLGKSYGVLPMNRGLRFDGAYRLVRHPIYASYALLDLGLALGAPSARNTLVLIVALTLYALRARYEEALLLVSQAYRDYTERVRYRFIPYVI